MELTWKDLTASLHRKRPPEEPPEPEQKSEPMLDEAVFEHLRSRWGLSCDGAAGVCILREGLAAG